MEAELAKPKTYKHEVILGVEYETKFGEKVSVVGGTDFLGNWELGLSFEL
jgi:hypothetical protein